MVEVAQWKAKLKQNGDHGEDTIANNNIEFSDQK